MGFKQNTWIVVKRPTTYHEINKSSSFTLQWKESNHTSTTSEPPLFQDFINARSHFTSCQLMSSARQLLQAQRPRRKYTFNWLMRGSLIIELIYSLQRTKFISNPWRCQRPFAAHLAKRVRNVRKLANIFDSNRTENCRWFHQPNYFRQFSRSKRCLPFTCSPNSRHTANAFSPISFGVQRNVPAFDSLETILISIATSLQLTCVASRSRLIFLALDLFVVSDSVEVVDIARSIKCQCCGTVATF